MGRPTLSSALDLGGSPRQEKPTKSPRKGGSEKKKKNKTNYRGYIEQCFGFRGVSKAGKAYEKPAKGGFRNFVSPEIGGCFQREGTKHICVP